MIVLLNYNKISSPNLDDILDKLELEYIYSNSESDLLNADRIILPNPNNFNSTFKMMNMMNLFSLLRIMNKPILGINNAVRLMCNQIGDNYKCGLGLFNLDTDTLDEIEEMNLEAGTIEISQESLLLPKDYSNASVNFDPRLHSLISGYSKSFIIKDESKFTLTLENNNYFGLELILDQNRSLAKEVIRNFCNIQVPKS